MNGIKGDDSDMMSIKTQIASDPTTNCNLNEAIKRMKDLRRSLSPTATSKYKQRSSSCNVCR